MTFSLNIIKKDASRNLGQINKTSGYLEVSVNAELLPKPVIYDLCVLAFLKRTLYIVACFYFGS